MITCKNCGTPVFYLSTLTSGNKWLHTTNVRSDQGRRPEVDEGVTDLVRTVVQMRELLDSLKSINVSL